MATNHEQLRAWARLGAERLLDDIRREFPELFYITPAGPQKRDRRDSGWAVDEVAAVPRTRRRVSAKRKAAADGK